MRILKLKKNKFYINKTPIFLKYGDTEKVFVSSNVFFAVKNYKYFIGYLYNQNKVKPLHIMLPKTSAHVQSYDG